MWCAERERGERLEMGTAALADAGDADGILVTVGRSKTNQVGETSDVRYLKNGAACAVRALRAAAAPAPEGRVVPLSPQAVGLRFTVAAEAAGLERRVTAHSGRVGLASELTRPRRVDYRRNARRKLENLENGGALLRRRDR